MAQPREAISLKDLNSEQREAVVHREGPLIVFAGAGTGKTRVITYRIAHMISERGVPGSKILAVTFTNKAAREMRERVRELLGEGGARGTTISTFHSLCVRILREDGHHIGLGENFSIFAEADQSALIRALLTEAGVEAPPGEILAAISLAKNRLITASDYPTETAQDVLVQGIYGQYQNQLAGMNAVDFDDLLLSVIRLFRAHGHAKVGWQRRFEHMLVDEFQDTNTAQYELLRLLWSGHGSLCVVGDDDQSIYTWRGAAADTFQRFAADFAPCKEVVLTQNYRSTTHILDAAHAIITGVPERKDKKLWSALGKGAPIEIVTATDADHEARQVVERINLARFAGKKDLSEFAVLIRTNIQSRPFEAALRESHLPYVVVGATGFFDRQEVRDLTAYLRFLHNDADEVALRRIVNTPRRGIGAGTLAGCGRFAQAHGISLFEAMDKAPVVPDLPKASVPALRTFVDLIAELRFDFQHGDLIAALRRVIQDTGLAGHWVESADNERQGEARVEGAEEIVRMLSNYMKREFAPTLAGFLEHLCLLDRLDDNDETGKGKVTIITLHAAKGLEFPHVFLAGFEEGFLPHTRSVEEGRELSEERRLAYVGLTRAQRRLTISYARTRSRYGEQQGRTPSRFLADIPPHLIGSGEEVEPEASAEDLAAGFFSAMKDMLK
ncbi:MAG: UvrD-helicase domain-containing protein [Nitrospirota bacterium]|nr:UvrD-helicase domain-containing protein [Nitrospirota bacterium]